MARIGFGPRLGAALIDVVIVLVIMSVGTTIFGVSLFGGALANPDMLGGAAVAGLSLAGIVMGIIPLAYMSTEIFQAATPGKMLLKLKIRAEDGSEADQNTLIKRFALKNSSALLNILAAITTLGVLSTLGSLAGLVIGVGCFLTLTAAKQALHDTVAKTAVFKQGE